MTRRLASVGLFVAGIATLAGLWTFAAISGSFVYHYGPVADAGQIGAFLTVCGVLGLVAGGLIVRRQPQRWTGPFFQLVVLTSVAGQARVGVGAAVPFLAAVWLASLLLPGILALSQPDGIVERWPKRLLVGVTVLTALLSPLVVLAAHGRAGANTTWWETPDVVHGPLPMAQTLFAVHTGVVVFGLVVVGGLLTKRLLVADRALRRLIAPVAIPGLIWTVSTGTGQLARLAGPDWAIPPGFGFNGLASFVLEVAPLLSTAGILVGFAWMELVVPRTQRTLTGLAMRLEWSSADLTTYLVRALGDSSVKVLFRGPAPSTWIDGAGRPVSLADEDGDRGVVVIERDGAEIGAIEYDISLNSQPEVVELVVTAAALAIDSARLVALAIARAEEARRLTARLVTSAEAAREQLFRKLAEGPLPELEAIEQIVVTGDLVDAARRLQAVAAQVRHISHGLYPSELTTGGLAAALSHLAEVPTGRYSSAVEITAFLAADGDPLASIRREPGQLVIALSRPPRDPAVLARVAVLGGTVHGHTMTVPIAAT